MRIGITFDLKGEPAPDAASAPDDLQEEFDAPETIEAIAQVLRGLGHTVSLLGDGRPMLDALLANPPQFVLNLAEGLGVSRSREARVPAVLEMLGIPYTGSDPLTLSVTLDKDCAKRLVASHGIAVPKGVVLRRREEAFAVADSVGFPAIAKPAWEGSSKGIRAKCIVNSASEMAVIVDSLRRDHGQPVLVEEYIEGDELTVGMIGNDPAEVMAVMRVVPKQTTKGFIYSLEVKRDFRRLVSYEVPAKLPGKVTSAVEQASRTVFRALGCRDVARIDFRVRDGVPYFLEVNPLPGLKPKESDLVIMAEMAGWTYAELIEKIVNVALNRHTPRSGTSLSL